MNEEVKTYVLDNYGSCLRGADCYWGKDPTGAWNGCLRIGWRGVVCSSWVPVSGKDFDDLYANWVDNV